MLFLNVSEFAETVWFGVTARQDQKQTLVVYVSSLFVSPCCHTRSSPERPGVESLLRIDPPQDIPEPDVSSLDNITFKVGCF